jgi:hypothetical protein
MIEIMSRHAAEPHPEIVNIEENLGINLTLLFHKCPCFLAAIVSNDWRNYTDKKVNKICLLYKGIQMGSVAKSYMRKGFLIYGKCTNL